MAIYFAGTHRPQDSSLVSSASCNAGFSAENVLKLFVIEANASDVNEIVYKPNCWVIFMVGAWTIC